MKVPYSWLREYVPGAPDDVHEAARLLAVSGTAVETVTPVGVADASNGGGDAFRVGRVLEFEQHPDADRLRLVRVDVGEGTPRQIVCGASNFAAGDTVAVVLPGGRMPDGTEIREAKLRGVESRGMMLSERELGLSTDHAGIMILPAEWTPGAALAEHVPLGDHVLELELTSNRPDCLGVHGVARELATAAAVELLPASEGDAAATAPGDVRDHVSVELQAPELCPRYMARVFVDVRVGPSPLWLKARLAQAGMRAINNVVDVTNYVMLVTGQPLHAFDADRIPGGRIVVRRAGEDEIVKTLDDVERTLDESMLSIATDAGTAVIAGVMGAADVEVSDATTSLVLEAACFDGPSIQRTSRRLGLRSESSSRFEKGLDPHLPEVALRMASRLLVELCGAAMVPGTVDERAGDALPAPPTIQLAPDHAERVLGIPVGASDVEDTLTRLGFAVEAAADGAGWNVVAPHWRMFDTTRAIDLVEELGRFRLDDVPSLLPPIAVGGAMLTARQRLRRVLEETAAGIGLDEVVTYTMTEAGAGERLGVDAPQVVRLANPMTVEHVELRTSMLAGHLEVARRNLAAGERDIAIFEVGRTFLAADPGTTGDDGLPRFAVERDAIALLVAGSLGGARWDRTGVDADFPAVAGLVSSLLAATGVGMRLAPIAHPPGWMHPGQAAEVHADGGAADGALLGHVAAVHPAFAAPAGVEVDCFEAQLDLAALDAARGDVPRFRPYSDFPPVVEDIAVVLDDTVAAGAVLRAVREAGGELLERVEVFDRYVGEPVAAGHHSLALRLTFRAADRTLTDAETAPVREQIVAHLVERVGAVLRG